MSADFTGSGETPWGWSPRRGAGVWAHGPRWARPLVAAAPWIATGLLVLMFALVSGRFVSRPGVVFDLPEAASGDLRDAAPENVALVLSVPRETAGGAETLVFFDDARYVLSDAASARQLAAAVKERMARGRQRTLLLMCDRRVAHGEVMKFTDLARAAGVRQVQVAEKDE